MARLAGGERKDAVTLDQLPGFLMNAESATGISVTWSTALQVSAMFACARVVGEGLAQSRLRLMRPRKSGIGADVYSDHPLHRRLFLEPSAGMTAFSLIETVAIHLMFVGNAFVFVNRVGDNRVHELIVIEPGRVKVTRRADLTYRYEVAGDDGHWQPMPPGSVWHIRGPSWNGWMGLEPVKLAREALGLSLALEAGHARMHKSGATPSGAYAIDGELTVDQYKQLATWLKRYAAGGDLAGTPMILDRGAKWLAQQMTGVDAEHLETRRFQIEEVCRGARVLPIMVGLTDKTATYASVEQMLIAHATHTMSPWAGRIEQSVEVSLLTDAEKDEGLTARFNLNSLMRGAYKDRQEGLQIQRRSGVINANEWRELEDMNPRDDEGGNQYIVEANMAVQDGRDLPVVKPTTEKKDS
ncbi:phage portal protein [Sphingomonas sp. MG17]|uniref:Phage portal protein n=1 Tax=Sphingomonas tagetis TaxID=2949092 RepID=A0A9X2KK00_9SPHN|nr:phage portal protein [Sphingomonas tagetis]MCP3729265.1 phage portal protein [Sphingomonas tagetis]